MNEDKSLFVEVPSTTSYLNSKSSLNSNAVVFVNNTTAPGIIAQDTLYRVLPQGNTSDTVLCWDQEGSCPKWTPIADIVPDQIFIIGENSVVEGQSLQLTSAVVSNYPGSVSYRISSGGTTDQSIDANTGCLTTSVTGSARQVIVTATHTSTQGKVTSATKQVYIATAAVPTSGTINGADRLASETTYTLSLSPEKIDVEYSVQWKLSGEGATNEYVSIKSSDNASCTLQLNSSQAAGTITLIAEVIVGDTVLVTTSKTVVMGVSLQILMRTNQAEDLYLPFTQTADISYGSYTGTITNNKAIYVPANTIVQVTFKKYQKTNPWDRYKTPDPMTIDVGTTDIGIHAVWEADWITIKLTSDDGSKIGSGTLLYAALGMVDEGYSDAFSVPYTDGTCKILVPAGDTWGIALLEDATYFETQSGFQEASLGSHTHTITRYKKVFPTSGNITGEDRIIKDPQKYDYSFSPSNTTFSKDITWEITGEAAPYMTISRDGTVSIADTANAAGDLNIICHVVDSYTEEEILTLTKTVKVGYMVEVASLTSHDGSSTIGQTVYINDIGYTWNGTPIQVYLPMSTKFTIRASGRDGYFTPRASYTTGGQDTLTYNLEYGEEAGTWITINQTISDPATMISGDVNGYDINRIRKYSHRYLGKYTAEGEMTICMLDDEDSNYFYDGVYAVLTGEEGDVFMKMPTFYYKSRQKSTDIWEIGFYCGENDPGLGWNKWDRDTLIGVYKSYVVDNKAFSMSGYVSTNGSHYILSIAARNRGTGYQLVDWQMHCVMALLFYAQYGHTNCQEKIGYGSVSRERKSGTTNIYGMSDTEGNIPTTGLNDSGFDGNTKSINFWGLEDWWGGQRECIDNVLVYPQYCTITQPSGSVRRVEYSLPAIGSIGKLTFDSQCDLFPVDTSASSTTGFCDYLRYFNSTSTQTQVLLRSGYGNVTDGGIVDLALTPQTSIFSDTTSRLSFRGKCVIEEDSDIFRAKQAIN